MLRELQERLGLPRKIRLSRNLWVAAAVLGLLRTAVNDPHRVTNRNRGPSKNILNDLQGSLGELVGLGLLDRADLSPGAQGLLDLEGSVDLPDLVANTNPQARLDVKCHFDEERKRLFLINEQARIRSIRRDVVAFLPIVTAELRQDAYVGEPIPVEQLETWKREVVGEFGDPSRQLPLTTLDQQFLGNRGIRWRTGQLDRHWGPSLLPYDDLQRLPQVVGRSMLLELRRVGFTLDGLTYSEVKQALLDLLPRELRIELGVG